MSMCIINYKSLASFLTSKQYNNVGTAGIDANTIAVYQKTVDKNLYEVRVYPTDAAVSVEPLMCVGIKYNTNELRANDRFKNFIGKLISGSRIKLENCKSEADLETNIDLAEQILLERIPKGVESIKRDWDYRTVGAKIIELPGF